jgi:hypothetical protein
MTNQVEDASLFKSPGSVRKSGVRYNTMDEKTFAGSPTTARSPSTSPGRSLNEDKQNDLLQFSLAEATVKVDKLRLELDMERKKSSALREETEKISGKSDASLLVRKALEEEVKRSAALAARVEVLERESSTAQQEAAMGKEQNKRLKVMIGESSKLLMEQEQRLAAQIEASKDAHTSVQRLEAKLSAANALCRKMEDERTERVLAELKQKRKDQAARDALVLVHVLQAELADVSSRYLELLRDSTDRTAQSEALAALQDAVQLRVEPVSLCVDDTLEQEDSVETDSQSGGLLLFLFVLFVLTNNLLSQVSMSLKKTSRTLQCRLLRFLGCFWVRLVRLPL